MKFLVSFIFCVSPGFLNGKFYSLPITFKNLIRFVLSKNFVKSKYSISIYIIIFFYKLISVIYIPLGACLYFLNYRISLANIKSFGAFFEEIEIIAKKEANKKLIIFAPKNISPNMHIKKILKKKNIFFIDRTLLFFIFVPLSYINFLTYNPYLNTNNPSTFFLRQKKTIQTINYSNAYLNLYSNYFKFNSKFKLKLKYSHKYKNEILKKYNILNKKIVIFNSRNSNNARLRNANIRDYYKALNFLIHKNYFIINVSDKKIKIKANKNYLNLKQDNRFGELQIFFSHLANFYLGTGGGPSHLMDIMNKKKLITNHYPYFGFATKKNCKLLFKKIYYKKKVLNYFEAHKLGVHDFWSNKKINLKNNSSNEIFDFVKRNYKFEHKSKTFYYKIYKNKKLNLNLSINGADLNLQKFLYG